ncbi:hypothetical protein K450DRAFT_263203 [Umbelopsis ramanniana AG]|uniref:F-box/LRR-repeat protein 15-like leucin rich repeat domain-containing protein n=1 Tax=Umbelopsis ramanniana AG TaxID=1314678 RepID=A0AAD5H9R9_UMBRA|nr:uncharacterized protein K450DRAFT_263203 [Umbelopsis ramanniana AG]KAI8575129.1 hypothetical protein K450DRAFT_263203 [Umbelopsis ramanniana AG]
MASSSQFAMPSLTTPYTSSSEQAGASTSSDVEPLPLIDLEVQYTLEHINALRNPFMKMSAMTVATLILVMPNLRNRELYKCALLNREISSLANAILWKKPDFDSQSHSPLHCFNKFLNCLLILRPSMPKYIHEIDLALIEETLYEYVSEDWFDTIVRHCSELQVLRVPKARFLSAATIRKIHPYATLPKLHTLDLSHCDHVNEKVLKRLADLALNLRSLKLTHISGLSDAALSELVYTCHNLSSMDISYAKSLTNASLYSVAKFCTIRLRELDLSHNERISDDGLKIVAKYNIHLTYLNLCHISKITDVGINMIIKNTSRNLKLLHLYGCKGHKDPMTTMKLIASECQALQSLTISWQMVKDNIGVFKDFKAPLVHLTINKIPEHTPMKVLEQLVDLFRGTRLRVITFTRDWYSSDFVWGTYATVKSSGYSEINSANVNEFNLNTDSHIIALLVNERDQSVGYEMHNW